MELIEVSATESLEPISFRGSSEDRKIMSELSIKLNVRPSAIPRIAIRLLSDLIAVPRLVELTSRVQVNAVLRGPENVIRKARARE